MSNAIKQLFEQCGGIDVIGELRRNTHTGDTRTQYSFVKTGDITVPDDVYIEIDSTATAGTIGKLVAIDVGDLYENMIRMYDITFVIQVEDKSETNRIAYHHSSILKDHDGSTKYVRNIKKHEKEDIPEHVNKYKQKIKPGMWIVGLGRGKRLQFGEVTRYSKSSIWVNPTPSIKKSKEQCITYPRETLILTPDADHEQMVTMMVLSGWTG